MRASKPSASTDRTGHIVINHELILENNFERTSNRPNLHRNEIESMSVRSFLSLARYAHTSFLLESDILSPEQQLCCKHNLRSAEKKTTHSLLTARLTVPWFKVVVRRTFDRPRNIGTASFILWELAVLHLPHCSALHWTALDRTHPGTLQCCQHTISASRPNFTAIMGDAMD